ncbi:MAG: M55 family metallopeptidase [Candidatus Eremiobacteraeota bacterium]|nr:M55 family metallopeptidase [Candidatus Eremiobacteraeota bacterium]
MKLYVSCDMEGTAAVSSWTQCDPTNSTEYPYYRRLMSLEVRAAIDGAGEAGVTDVLVNDSHSSMRNVLWDELPAHARMIYGNRKPFSMTEGLGPSIGAAFFTGYHAAIGRSDGTLDHTYSPGTIYNVHINGMRCSEATLNAALAGFHGVPVVLITGDRTTIEDARTQMPWITGVVVKEAIGRYAVNSLSPQAARDAIRSGAKRAIETREGAKLFVFEAPIKLEIDFVGTEHADSVELMPGFQRSGDRSVRFVHDDYPTVFRAFVAAFRLGGAASVSV